MNRQRFAWCLFDFAHSAFSTIIVTFVYSAFFAEVLVGDPARGESLWGISLTIAGIGMAVLSPVLGSIADRARLRRRFLIGASTVTVLATFALFFPSPSGGEAAIWTAFVLVTVANIASEIAFVFYNSFLPHLGDLKSVGRLGGYGWAFGYVGGLICLLLSLVLIGHGELPSLLPTDDAMHVRATCLLVGAWFLVFALPMFLRSVEPPASGSSGRGGVRAVLQTMRELRGYPDLLRLFLARLFYNDGLMAIIGLAALYMVGTLGMETGETLMIGVWLNVIAGLGALGFGFVDDKIGARITVIFSLVLLFSGTVLAFAVPTKEMFWVAASLIGLGMGPNQSASRSLLARMVAPPRAAEFFGFFALSGKATVWIGPACYALIRPHVEDQRIALMPVLVLFAVGFVLVLTVDESRGIERASRA